MHLTDLLSIIIINPFITIYKFVFAHIIHLVHQPGWAIVIFSLLLNLAVLPIYRQMERASSQFQKSRSKMDEEINRIKSHYKGRERYYYIKTIHRQFKYRPINIVFTSGDLYLQMLIFMTVYHFIFNLPTLKGSNFYIINDLSRPDGLFLGLNVLPILMTTINIASSFFYTLDQSKRKTSLMLSLLFLVLLYKSPSSLVLYWTCNNAFSLFRNMITSINFIKTPKFLANAMVKITNQE